MLQIIQSTILGIVQGLTEFIPVSSSGHLLLIPKVLNWSEQSLAFDITLHLGTALALIVYFKNDFLKLIKSVLSDLLKYINAPKNNSVTISKDSKLAYAILLSTIPALSFGYLLNDPLENYFREIFWGVLFLVLGSILMFIAEVYYSNKNKKHNDIYEITFKNAFLIGLYQCLALFSGFSRSGSTISGGMLLGYTREVAAKFSFLMSLPVILSAGLYKLLTADPSEFLNISTLFGFLFSFLFGVIAINVLLKFLKSNNLYIFIAYRIVLALIIYVYVYL